MYTIKLEIIAPIPIQLSIDITQTMLMAIIDNIDSEGLVIEDDRIEFIINRLLVEIMRYFENRLRSELLDALYKIKIGEFKT